MFLNEQVPLTLYGKNRIFMHGARLILERITGPRGIRVRGLIYVGLTLPEAMRQTPRTEPDECLVVFCSAACHRMLKGIRAYASALFLQEDLSVEQVQQLYRQWLWSPKKGNVLQLRIVDNEALYVLLSGQAVTEMSFQLSNNSKTLYSRLSSLAKRMGTRTRQELYLKALLHLNLQESYAHTYL